MLKQAYLKPTQVKVGDTRLYGSVANPTRRIVNEVTTRDSTVIIICTSYYREVLNSLHAVLVEIDDTDPRLIGDERLQDNSR